MLKKYKIAIVILIVILIAVIIYFTGFDSKSKKDNSVVYLSTGEVYVGKLSTFPQFKLKDSYIFQVVTDSNDSTKSNFQLIPVRDALWAPKYLYLNKDQVIFYGPIKESSQIGEALNK